MLLAVIVTFELAKAVTLDATVVLEAAKVVFKVELLTDNALAAPIRAR